MYYDSGTYLSGMALARSERNAKASGQAAAMAKIDGLVDQAIVLSFRRLSALAAILGVRAFIRIDERYRPAVFVPSAKGTFGVSIFAYYETRARHPVVHITLVHDFVTRNFGLTRHAAYEFGGSNIKLYATRPRKFIESTELMLRRLRDVLEGKTPCGCARCLAVRIPPAGARLVSHP